MNRLIVGVSALVVAMATPRLVHACGGCFSPPPPPDQHENASLVTDHRMVLSLSERETTLWDQIRYSGSPSDFVWVLPVADASTLRFGLADDNFVNALDAFSAPEITAMAAGCIPAGSDGHGAVIGCGANNGPGSLPPGAGTESTRIMRDGEAIVGPYDVSVISTENGGMRLDEWLTSHGYQVPAQTQAIIDFYVGLQFDFIALRLAPGAGVQEMQPVRVTTRGYSPVLPLRMVAAGVGDKVGLSLMVIASSRMEAQGFANVQISESDLTWDWNTMHSNYNDLFHQAITANHGRAWITESVQNILASQLTYPIGWGPGHMGSDAGMDGGVTMPWNDAGDVFGMDFGDASMASDAGAMEMTDGGMMPTPDPFIDRTTAFEGLGAQAVVTRLRTELNAADLDMDLILEASDGSFISSQYVIRAPYGTCPPPNYACAVIGSGTPVALEAMFVVIVISRVRAHRRRKRERNNRSD